MYLSDFQYDLPDDHIARYPLSDRDQSRLLVFGEDHSIGHSRFSLLPGFIPPGSMLVFNDTKVIPARAILSKPTGARIELLLLHPEYPTRIVSEAMRVTERCTWECMVGNKKKWKTGDVLHTELSIDGKTVDLKAEWKDRERNLVEFSWSGGDFFVDVIIAVGQIPLPPYLGREAEEADSDSYQTVYAKQDGAVAAPTAGLHFTEKVLGELEELKIESAFVTLHVGAGTFQPVKTENVREHRMHSEQIVFTKALVNRLSAHHGKLVAVGTTSLRSLESLYWFGVKCLAGQPSFFIGKDDPYREYAKELPSRGESLRAVADYMQARSLDVLEGETEIFITPGYTFRMVEGLITNFHQPGSTLILLIAAFVGEGWRKIYDTALKEGYRFLSYGDSSLLWCNKKRRRK